AAVEQLFALAKGDADAGVQVQAIRALADLTDPVLVRHRLDAGPGDAALAERFAALAAGREARVRLEVILALGRLHWRGAPAWLRREIDPRDPALAHAALWSRRQAGAWPAVLKCLDEPDTDPFRAVARRAVAGRYDGEVVDGLAERLGRETDPARRREYAGLLGRVHRTAAVPPGRPGPPRPPATWRRPTRGPTRAPR